jgi:predicted DNA-binding transcriptional regulator AlpA
MELKEIRHAAALSLFVNLPDEAGARLPVVCAVLGCSNATVWRLAKTGKITARKISKGVTVFNVGSIRALLNGEI